MELKDSPMSYEEIRKQRLEENKKRMEELGLTGLSKSLSNSLTPLKSPVSRQVKPRAFRETVVIELRRSSRNSNSPQPNYREVEVDLSLGRRSYARSSLFARKYASDEARLEAANKAEDIEKELPSNNPSFVKPMLQSHVSGGFWLGLPSVFCKNYLPKKDDMIVLEDEKGEEWDTVYLSNKTGLSGGWRGFSLDHGLEDGDALVFELVEPNRFKVHIVRASEAEAEVKEEERVAESSEEIKVHAVKGKDEADGTLPEKGNKRKQRLVKEKSDSGVGMDSEEVDATPSKKGKKKKQRLVKESDSDVGTDSDEADAGCKNSSKASSKHRNGVDAEKTDAKTGKKVKGKTEGKFSHLNEEIFEEDDKNYTGSKVDGRQVREDKKLTDFLRAKKTLGSSGAPASKKAMMTPNDVIEVY